MDLSNTGDSGERVPVSAVRSVKLNTRPLSLLPQALDGAFNDENREKCKAATGPLIEAVDNLTAFASNPEFASVPAQISPEVRSPRTLSPPARGPEGASKLTETIRPSLTYSAYRKYSEIVLLQSNRTEHERICREEESLEAVLIIYVNVIFKFFIFNTFAKHFKILFSLCHYGVLSVG